jgi:hypothetical protein
MIQMPVHSKPMVAWRISDFNELTEPHRMRYAVELPPLRNHYENSVINLRNALQSAKSGGHDKRLCRPIRLD